MRTLAALTLAAILGLPLGAQAGEYRQDRAGHPLMVVYYAAHPVGYLLDRLIFFPAWVIGQHQPFRTLFGVDRVQPDVGFDDDEFFEEDVELEPEP